MHILLVEDDPMIGEAVREALTDEGYDVLWAKSGWEAGGMLAAGTFDVVFLDLGLPGRDGMALVAVLVSSRRVTMPLVSSAAACVSAGAGALRRSTARMRARSSLM